MDDKLLIAVAQKAEKFWPPRFIKNSFASSLSMPMTLAKEKRIRKRRDYLRVQRQGFRAFGRFIVVVAKRDQDKSSLKIGITVPKKVGPAHIRNKVKRRIRHIMRVNQNKFLELSLVIVARELVINASFSELEKDILETGKRLKTSSSILYRQRSPVKMLVGK